MSPQRALEPAQDHYHNQNNNSTYNHAEHCNGDTGAHADNQKKLPQSRNPSSHNSLVDHLHEDVKINVIFVVVVALFATIDYAYCNGFYEKKFVVEDDLRIVRLHSEQAFYYSFYTDVINAPSLSEALNLLTKDERSEHPDVINALARFNIIPELILGIVKRQTNSIYQDFLWSDFRLYAFSVYILHALQMVFLMFLSSIVASEPVELRDLHYASLPDPVMAVNQSSPEEIGILSDFYAAIVTGIWLLGNFDNMTRVSQLTLRENWSLPFLWLQLLCVVSVLKVGKMSWKMAALTLAATLAFMLPWQLTSFVMLTQCLSIIAVEIVTMISMRRMAAFHTFSNVHRSVIRIHIVAFVLTSFLQFGNRMVMTSPAFHLAIAFEAAHIILDLWTKYRGPMLHDVSLTGHLGIIRIHVILMIILFVGIKKLSASTFDRNGDSSDDDSHVWGLLVAILYNMVKTNFPFLANSVKGHLTQYCDEISNRFDVKIYLKENVFKPTPTHVWKALISTGAGTIMFSCIIPTIYLLVIEIISGVIPNFPLVMSRATDEHTASSVKVAMIEPYALFFAFQSAAFIILGILIRRLMVFTVPILGILMAFTPIISVRYILKLIDICYRSFEAFQLSRHNEAFSSSSGKKSPSSRVSKTNAKKRQNVAGHKVSESSSHETDSYSINGNVRDSNIIVVLSNVRPFVRFGVNITCCALLLALCEKNMQKNWSNSQKSQNLYGVEEDALNMVHWLKTYTILSESENDIDTGKKQILTISSDMTVTSHIRALLPNAHVTNHPHFEDVHARKRTRQVYSIFGCAPNRKILSSLQSLGADMLIINHAPAFKTLPLQCTLLHDDESDICGDETALTLEMFPVRCMWPANEGFTMVYHDHTYTVLTIRSKHGEQGKNIFSSEIGSDHVPVQRTTKDQSCSPDSDNRSSRGKINSIEDSNPYVIYHSGFFRYFASCMKTDENCIEHILHLCDMWERLLRAKPLTTAFHEFNHNLDVDMRYQRVASIYASAIAYFNVTAQDYEGSHFTFRDTDKLEDIMENNIKACLKKFPLLIYEYAEFLNYAMKDYELAETYYLRALEKVPQNVEFMLGYAKFLYYSILAVEEAHTWFKRATDHIEAGTAKLNLDLESFNFPHHAPFGSADHTTEDYREVYAEVFCEYGTYLLKSIDRRMMNKNNSNDRRVTIASFMYNQAYQNDKQIKCLRELYPLLQIYEMNEETTEYKQTKKEKERMKAKSLNPK